MKRRMDVTGMRGSTPLRAFGAFGGSKYSLNHREHGIHEMKRRMDMMRRRGSTPFRAFGAFGGSEYSLNHREHGTHGMKRGLGTPDS
jgi:hypothetical protein